MYNQSVTISYVMIYHGEEAKTKPVNMAIIRQKDPHHTTLHRYGPYSA